MVAGLQSRGVDMAEVIISQQAFLDSHGEICPCCKRRADHAEGGIEHAGSGYAYQSFKCDNCGETWDEEYKLVGFVKV